MRQVILLLFSLSLVLPMTVAAQDDEKQAYIDYLNAAYANFSAVSSYGVTVDQTVEQSFYNVGSEELLLTMTVDQQQEGQAILGTPHAIASRLTQTLIMSIPTYDVNQSIETTAEAILVDGIYYLRFGENEIGLPTTWVNMNEDSSQVPGAEIYNVDALSNMAGLSLPTQPIDITMIDHITTLPPEVLEGQKLRGFELVWNTSAIRETDVFNLTAILNVESMGGNTERFIEDYLANFTFTQRVWIGINDNLPHRIETLMEVDTTISAAAIEGGPLDLVQTTAVVLSFHSFNAAFEIIAPIEE